MTQAALFDRPFSKCTIEIKKDEDWNDTLRLKRLMADGSTSDFDFSDTARIDLYIRPRFDHSSLIRQMSSVLGLGNEVKYTRSVPGTLQIVCVRSNVIASLPVGRWDQFLVGTYDNGNTFEFWRGPLIVHPGKI